jgi:hypothetical protein
MYTNNILAGWLMPAAEYESLLATCQVLGWGGNHIKVLETPDEQVIKLYQLKPKFSSAWFYPYSFRFARNARRLAECGVPTVEVTGTFFLPKAGVHDVVYPMLQGEVLRDLDLNQDILSKLADFVAKLHGLGIYFRGLHLGNVVALPDGELGLIDIGNVLFKGRPLRNGERIRNLSHLFRREDNLSHFDREGASEFLALYKEACSANHKLSKQLATFRHRLEQDYDGQTNL